VGSLRDPVTTDPDLPSGSDGEIVGPALLESKFTATIIRRPQSCNAACFGSYVSGYVDGEGCFTVSISQRSKMRMGWEVRPSFSVSQNYDRAQTLYRIAEYFNCGTIRPDRSDKTLKFEVRSLQDLVDRISPHFEEHPLLSEKQQSFLAFREICLEMVDGKHLLAPSLESILLRANRINGGKRKYRFGKI